ncbi:MAG: VOC family protein [Candidatus Bathyarchaeia archaeon]
MNENKTNAVLDTVIIQTTRMKELAKFYHQDLQLEVPIPHGDDHLGFQLSGTYLGFDQVDKDRAMHPGAVSLWFRVDSIEAAFERLREIGAEVKYPPTKKPWGDVLAAVQDPDGNIIGLAQR